MESRNSNIVIITDQFAVNDDTLEYGVMNAAGDIDWFPVDTTVETAEEARQNAVNYADSDQFFRLVCR